MKFTFRRAAAATAVAGAVLAMAAPALASDPYFNTDYNVPANATAIGGAGSTFAAPLQQVAQGAFAARSSNSSFNAYQAVGSGAGEQDIITSATTGINWGGTDVPMTAKDIAKYCSSSCPTLANFVQVPIGLGGVALVYNLPGVKTGLKLSGNMLANIYNGHITMWNDPRIKAANPGVTLPAHVIHPIFRQDSSGTSYIFTDFLSTSTASTPPPGSSGTSPAGPGGKGAWPYHPSKNEINTYAGVKNGYAFTHNGGVAQGISSTQYSIGYVEYSYVLLNPGLKAGIAAILNGSGKYLQPTSAGVQADASLFPNVSSTNFSIVFGKGSATAYPIAGYTWAVIWKVQNAKDQNVANNTQAKANGTELVKYLDWLAQIGTSANPGGQHFGAENGYVPLPAAVSQLATNQLATVVNAYNQKCI